MSSVVGIDVGGTKIRAIRFLSSDMEGVYHKRLLTEAKKGADVVFENIVHAIEGALDESVTAIGIAWAGFVDHEKGIVRTAPNIPGFSNFPLAERLKEKFGLPVILENDARLFAYAEATCGAGRDEPVVVGISLGTGVGSGMILNGNIFRGAEGFSGEVGQAFASTCDLKTIETNEFFISGTGLGRDAERFGLKDVVFGNEAFRKWQDEESPEYDLFELWLTRLSRFLVNIILFYNPSVVVFGGGVGRTVFPPFLPEICIRTKFLLKKRNLPPSVFFRLAEIPYSAAFGAGLLAKKISK